MAATAMDQLLYNMLDSQQRSAPLGCSGLFIIDGIKYNTPVCHKVAYGA